VTVGRETIVTLLRIAAGRARIGLRCPAGWRVEQLELAELKRDRNARPWRASAEPIWKAPREAQHPGENTFAGAGVTGAHSAATPETDDRRTRFFELPPNGALKIGPAIRVRVADLTERVAIFEIDGVADDEIEAV